MPLYGTLQSFLAGGTPGKTHSKAQRVPPVRSPTLSPEASFIRTSAPSCTVPEHSRSFCELCSSRQAGPTASLPTLPKSRPPSPRTGLAQPSWLLGRLTPGSALSPSSTGSCPHAVSHCLSSQWAREGVPHTGHLSEVGSLRARRVLRLPSRMCGLRGVSQPVQSCLEFCVHPLTCDRAQVSDFIVAGLSGRYPHPFLSARTNTSAWCKVASEEEKSILPASSDTSHCLPASFPSHSVLGHVAWGWSKRWVFQRQGLAKWLSWPG